MGVPSEGMPAGHTDDTSSPFVYVKLKSVCLSEFKCTKATVLLVRPTPPSVYRFMDIDMYYSENSNSVKGKHSSQFMGTQLKSPAHFIQYIEQP